jgi:tetratricopeptide (TPR) repeat protein
MAHRNFLFLAFSLNKNDKYRLSMISYRVSSVLTLLLLVGLLDERARTLLPNSPGKPDYSQEASVIEELSTKIAYANDGNSRREQTSRVRVQTDAGVQHWGVISFPFESATQTLEIDYVRVRKADGSQVLTPPDNVQDLDSEITRSAPFYSDLREKHVAVKGLGKGDILEFSAHWRTTKPLIAGQFWLQYNFQHEAIVLTERLEVKVPGERPVKVKGPKATQTETAEPGARIYSWSYSNLQSAKDSGSDQKKATDAALGLLPAPDIQISSFQDWEEVGRWYWNLQKDRSEPTPAIRAKAAELTQGMTDDAARLRTLYSFVSTHYRYIGIAFGIGRYQPHAAEDILSNNYGDCKDKQTLLASLLQASGITLSPALISSSRTLDPDVPSPAQFDHVIGYLPQSKEPLWLDSTPEVAPPGFLIQRLRNKPALVMSGEKSIRLVTTPADPPFPSKESFTVEAKLSDEGTLEAKIEDTSRGDSEVIVRTVFRQVPQPQWKELVQRISYGLGFAGTVSDIHASVPESIVEPFHFSYAYSRKDYPTWKSDKQFTVPGLPFFLPPIRDDATYPVWLGSPLEVISDSRVELPKEYRPQAPPNVDLKYDFAEYHASYSIDQGVLVAKRRLIVKLREVTVSEFEDYRSFLKNMENDVNRYVQTSSSTASVPSGPITDPAWLKFGALEKSIWGLPDGASAKANEIEADARESLKEGDRLSAIKALKRASEIDPKFTRARLALAVLYMGTGQNDLALGAWREAIAADSTQVLAHKMYAMALLNLHRYATAMDAWREVIKIAPDDLDANAALGELFMREKRYIEAQPYLEAAAKNNNSNGAQYQLGFAYLNGGQADKGMAILQKLIESDPSPMMLNNIAYGLTETNGDLAKALEYAERAVSEQEKASYDIKLADLLPEDLACTQKLGMFWDTLGWVHFRLGHLDRAEAYLQSAWLLQQHPVEADHLGQLYEQQQKKTKAIHMYRMAIATPEAKAPGGSWDETRHRLEHLTGSKAPSAMDLLRSDPSGGELSELRTVKLKPLISGSATAEFFLLFSPGPKVEEVEFISGSEKLKTAVQALSAAKYQVAFPEGSSAHLVRRAILMCSSVSGCNAVLFTPDSVHSVN